MLNHNNCIKGTGTLATSFIINIVWLGKTIESVFSDHCEERQAVGRQLAVIICCPIFGKNRLQITCKAIENKLSQLGFIE